MPANKEPIAVAVSDLPPCEPQTIAPLNKYGKPDLYNYLPTRAVTRDEALLRGWDLFYIGNICRYGHQAPRYVRNPRICIDCARIKSGKTPIGPKLDADAYKHPGPSLSQKIKRRSKVEALRPPTPDQRERRFLEAYAKTKDFDSAALNAGLTSAQIDARLAWSDVFKKAFHQLEERLGIPKTKISTEPYNWTKAKRDRFIEIFVDTGDMATARDAIRVTPSEFFREIERNHEFDEQIKQANPLANRALEERAIQLALAGNDKLLTKILSAKMPEYREKVNVEMNVNEQLTDDQLEVRLARIVGKYKKTAIDAEFRPIIEDGQGAITQDSRGVGEERSSESNQPILQLTGKSS